MIIDSQDGNPIPSCPLNLFHLFILGPHREELKSSTWGGWDYPNFMQSFGRSGPPSCKRFMMPKKLNLWRVLQTDTTTVEVMNCQTWWLSHEKCGISTCLKWWFLRLTQLLSTPVQSACWGGCPVSNNQKRPNSLDFVAVFSTFSFGGLDLATIFSILFFGSQTSGLSSFLLFQILALGYARRVWARSSRVRFVTMTDPS